MHVHLGYVVKKYSLVWWVAHALAQSYERVLFVCRSCSFVRLFVRFTVRSASRSTATFPLSSNF